MSKKSDAGILAVVQKQAAASEVEQLTERVTKLKTKLTAAQEQLAEQAEEIAERDTEITQLRERIAELEAQLPQAKVVPQFDGPTHYRVVCGGVANVRGTMTTFTAGQIISIQSHGVDSIEQLKKTAVKLEPVEAH